MIDPRNEQLIRLDDVPSVKWLPGGKGKKRLHVSTVFRWAQRGVGGIVLETITVSGAKCTTEAALVRFFQRRSDQDQRHPTPVPPERRKRIEAHMRDADLITQTARNKQETLAQHDAGPAILNHPVIHLARYSPPKTGRSHVKPE